MKIISKKIKTSAIEDINKLKLLRQQLYNLQIQEAQAEKNLTVQEQQSRFKVDQTINARINAILAQFDEILKKLESEIGTGGVAVKGAAVPAQPPPAQPPAVVTPQAAQPAGSGV